MAGMNNEGKETNWRKIFWHIIGIAFICFWVWSLIVGIWGNKGVKVSSHGCHEDKYGNEICYEDPRN